MAPIVRKRTQGDVVFLAAAVVAAILVVHILFSALGTNPANPLVRTSAHWSAWLAAWFDDLFQPANERLEIFLNYGLAAICYLTVGGVLRLYLDR